MPKTLVFVILFILAAVGYFLFFSKNFGVALPTPGVRELPLGPGKNKFSTSGYEIILLGDIMLGRSVMTTSLLKHNNPNYPFEKVAEKLKATDIVFGNLENPVIQNCPYSDSGFKFCADPKMLQGLNFAGVDIVSLANNHSENYGTDGYGETKGYLRNSGIDYTGDGNLVIKEAGRVKYGFLGFDLVAKSPLASDFDLIKEADSKVDVLLVMVHWGEEYTPLPTNRQKEMAKNIIGAGADIIVGSHPHRVQTTEYVGGKIVIYSLGNFVFDQPWSEETKKGLAVRLTFDEDGHIIKIEELPVYMNALGQPEWTGEN